MSPSRPSVLAVRSFPGPETIHRQTLPNGIVVMARENFSSPSVVVVGYLAAGALDEQPAQAGLADLTASSLTRGTQRRTFREIYETLESSGASLGVGAGTHNISFRAKALAEDLPMLLEVLADVLRQPTFPEKEVDRLRGEKVTGLAIRDQDTASVAQMAFEELAYPGHPYRLPTDGYRHTVERLRTKDLKRFHASHFGPRGMLVTVVGAVPAAQATEQVQAHFGSWSNPSQAVQAPLPPLPPLTGLLRKDVPIPGKSQCDLVLGAPGPSRLDPDYLAAAVGNNILGVFGLMGRLGDAVRKQAGLAYHASSHLGGGLGPTPWQIEAGVAPANVERALDLARRELRRFTTRRVTPQELSDNQANFVGRLPLQLESNEGVASALLAIERYELPLDFYQQYPSLIRAISADQVLHVAQRYLHPDRLVIAVAGSPAADAGR
jgi:zinc protease